MKESIPWNTKLHFYASIWIDLCQLIHSQTNQQEFRMDIKQVDDFFGTVNMQMSTFNPFLVSILERRKFCIFCLWRKKKKTKSLFC